MTEGGTASLKGNKVENLLREVYVDKTECTSCGQCADDLPEVFRMDDDDMAEVHDPKGGAEEENQEEIDACPGECIHWRN